MGVALYKSPPFVYGEVLPKICSVPFACNPFTLTLATVPPLVVVTMPHGVSTFIWRAEV